MRVRNIEVLSRQIAVNPIDLYNELDKLNVVGALGLAIASHRKAAHRLDAILSPTKPEQVRDRALLAELDILGALHTSIAIHRQEAERLERVATEMHYPLWEAPFGALFVIRSDDDTFDVATHNRLDRFSAQSWGSTVSEKGEQGQEGRPGFIADRLARGDVYMPTSRYSYEGDFETDSQALWAYGAGMHSYMSRCRITDDKYEIEVMHKDEAYKVPRLDSQRIMMDGSRLPNIPVLPEEAYVY